MAQRKQVQPPSVLRGAGRAEAAAYRARARRLGLTFVSHVELGPGALTSLEAVAEGKVAKSAAGDLIIAPDEDAMPGVLGWLNAYGRTARPRIAVSTPTAIRAALREAGAPHYLGKALGRVEAVDPACSARQIMTPRQGAAGALLVAALLAAVVAAPLATLALIELAAAVFFATVAAIRFLAAALVGPRAPRGSGSASKVLPVYTILVPLRHEAHMLRQIVAGLDRLAWPRDHLDIKLVIDADDTATLAAARIVAPEHPYEVIVVPPGGPCTKPTALQYALNFARGDFVTVYDAEDRPHPGQLAEAHARFTAAPESLACLQAPLVIDNDGDSRIAALFAIEYATLFDGLLPALGRLDLPLPLGGTSNHFRREALERIGGWDPWNVTEDADLGIRLTRFGYAIGTITRPTFEEAPAALRPWLRQRTRWLKGWLQTWLVHMRQPIRLWRTLGTRRMAAFNALGLGMLVSAIAHPIFLVTPLLLLIDPGRLWGDGDLVVAGLAGLSIFNLAAGYAAMWTLAERTLALRGRSRLSRLLILLPAYWLLMAVACVLAVAELVHKPHHWNKTPHRGGTRAAAAPAPPAATHSPSAGEARQRARRA
ncbi:MAG: glycosyltransferase [Bauldia sp.]|nr:glycosyltransferase [Bauldia sp.]